MQNDKKPVKKFGMHSNDSLKHGCKQCNCPKTHKVNTLNKL